MNKTNPLIKIYTYIVTFFAAGIFSLIFVMSFISTCYISSDADEHTYFLKDNIFINLLVIVCFLAIILFISKKNSLSRFNAFLDKGHNFLITKYGLLLLILCISLFWALITKVEPASDQAMLFAGAQRLREGNLKDVMPGGYLDMLHNQIGLTLIEYYASYIFGFFNTTIFGIANAIGVTYFYKKLLDIMNLRNASKVSQILTLILGLLFIPFTMYVTFSYGTIISVALAIGAFDYLLRFLKHGHFAGLFLSVLFIVLAFQIKNNALIMMIAMVIYAIVAAIYDKTPIKKAIIFFLLLIPVFILAQKAGYKIIYDKTGYKLNQGTSSWSYIAMGFQESDYAPGWFNAYNHYTYYTNGLNTKQQEIVAKQNIKERFSEFNADKKYAFQFFSMKIGSMWNEPSFEGFWITQTRPHNEDLPWLNHLLSPKFYSNANLVLGALHLLLLLGCILWIIFVDKEALPLDSFFIVCIIGGFLFHLMWEAKSQYSLCYVVLMLPLAVLGYEKLVQNISEEGFSIKKVFRSNGLAMCILIAVAVIYLVSYALAGNHCLTGGNEIYTTYLSLLN